MACQQNELFLRSTKFKPMGYNIIYLINTHKGVSPHILAPRTGNILYAFAIQQAKCYNCSVRNKKQQQQKQQLLYNKNDT